MIYLHQLMTELFRHFAKILFSRNKKKLAKISEFTVILPRSTVSVIVTLSSCSLALCIVTALDNYFSAKV